MAHEDPFEDPFEDQPEEGKDPTPPETEKPEEPPVTEAPSSRPPQDEPPQQDPFSDTPKIDPETQDVQHFTQSPQMNPQAGAQQGYQETLPDATAVLVLGILSIVGAFCYGIVGIILGIIGMALASRAERRYKADPSRYSTPSYNNMKAGKICSLIGLILGVLMIIIVVIYIVWYVNLMNDMTRYDWRY